MSAVALDLAIVLFVAVAAIVYFVFATFLFGAGYEPTYRRAVDTMLRFAEVGPNDTVFDLGAGTGAIVFRAARAYRARVVGVEIEPFRVLILRLRRRFGPFADRITLVWGDLYGLPFGEATVVTAFLWPAAMARLRPKFEAELKPGTRLVSHCHAVPGWTPVRHDAETDVYLYRWPESRGETELTAGGG